MFKAKVSLDVLIKFFRTPRYFNTDQGSQRTIKYEEVYLHAYESVSDARQRIGRFIDFYNTRCPHSSLGKKTADEFYFASMLAIQQAA